LLGLSAPAEREHIESQYFEDDDAFQEMLTAEDDLIDRYARGELAGEERRAFEHRFVSSFRKKDRVQFARAFAVTVSANQPTKTKIPNSLLDIFKIVKSPRLLRTATVAAAIVFVVVLAWLVIDRSRMTNQLRELRAESAELSRRTEALQRNSDTERTRAAEVVTQPEDLQAKPDKPRHRERRTIVTQQTTSSSGGSILRGTATDPKGNVVSGATVTLTDASRNVTRIQHTNKDGAYVFNAIPPGIYSIKVQAKGFKTALAASLAVLVDHPTVRDLPLEVGAVSESVDITSAADAAISTNDAIIGNSFENKRITELPLNANNVVGLLTLQPDTSRTGYVNGGRTDQSNLTLDGVDTAIRISSVLSWIRFQITLETAATHDDYRVTINTVDGRALTSVDWIEPLTPNQTIIETPAISTVDLPSGDYVLLLMGKDIDGSLVKVAEYPFKFIRY
jgi:hypothetical protein